MAASSPTNGLFKLGGAGIYACGKSLEESASAAEADRQGLWKIKAAIQAV
jgi:hypothetical protein